MTDRTFRKLLVGAYCLISGIILTAVGAAASLGFSGTAAIAVWAGVDVVFALTAGWFGDRAVDMLMRCLRGNPDD